MNPSPGATARLVAVLFLCASSLSLASAQLRISRSLIVRTEAPSFVDFSPSSADTLELRGGTIKPAKEENAKSPGLAALLSAVLPGAGQVYAERYWTIPIFWGFGYYFAGVYRDENRSYHDYQHAFSESLAADTLNHQGDPALLGVRDFYRDERDRFAIYFVLTYLVNIIDAYVGASLYSFDVSGDLGGSSKLTLRIPMESVTRPVRR